MRADSQKLDITLLENVVVRLDEGLRRYLKDVTDAQIRDGLIQRFEFTDVSADARQDQSYL